MNSNKQHDPLMFLVMAAGSFWFLMSQHLFDGLKFDTGIHVPLRMNCDTLHVIERTVPTKIRMYLMPKPHAVAIAWL